MTKLPRKAEYIVVPVAQPQQQHYQGYMQQPPPSPLSLHMPITAAALATAAAAVPSTNAGRMMTGPVGKEVKRPASSLGAAVVDTADDICAGLEFKFLVPRHRAAVDGGSTTAAAAAGGDQQAIAQLHRDVYSDIAESIRERGMKRAITIHKIQDEKRQEREYWQTHWIVKKANSAEPVEVDLRFADLLWVPLELCSPKLWWRDLTVPQTIRDVVRSVRFPHRATVNYTCDVHVHVGRNDGLPFTLLTFKRLATLLWLAEPVLRKVRDPRSPNYSNIYTWGAELRKHSRLALNIAKGEDYNRSQQQQFLAGSSGSSQGDESVEWYLAAAWRRLGVDDADQHDALKAIWLTKSTMELGRLLSGRERQYRRLGFNFSALGEEDDRARTGPRTIEFRVLEGTLDADLILAWVNVCCTLAETATSEQEARFVTVVKYLLGKAREMDANEGAALDGEFAELMRRLGVDEEMSEPLLAKVRSNYGCLE
ncbi:uncharacterized protein E0L32_007408 [Thyridium curvatum]|uniref:Uncharacterized protein n=1 Tax=Thyridium curvatum TaxID=1093900 RepID=A0A507B5K6_9PEZI|nr:uncharacterized protein E0L32_007408 [Thyridium curvatum]TPX11910.1 hypothetical protein E0L32_007408 [Thyridium curvatum]